jgi:hypothetical protein
LPETLGEDLTEYCAYEAVILHQLIARPAAKQEKFEVGGQLRGGDQSFVWNAGAQWQTKR